MAIKAGDVKLVASAVMDDVPEGGGPPSTHVIQDNVSNEIFKDISESDRARGRLNAAKVHVSVQTADTDTYLGANFIVGRPPDDPNVSISLFTTNDVYDQRAAAIARLEAYLNKGSEWNGFLLENHIQGQRTMQICQRIGTEIPPIGRTLCLVQNEGQSNQIEQYVRVTRVTSSVREFTIGTIDFSGLVVTAELSDPLRYDFRGTPANRQFIKAAGAATVRDTTVADAAVYAGVVPLAEPITLGDFGLKAETIFTNLVPSAQVETPIVAQNPVAASGVPARSGRTITYSTSQTFSPTTAISLPGGCTPGTLRIAAGGATLTDRAGSLLLVDQVVGAVDYANGLITVASATYDGTKQITYEPAAFLVRVPQTVDIEITQESRSLNYTGFMPSPPMPSSVTLSYMAQGRWYVLSDDGVGGLRGFETSYGAGTVNYTDGSFVVTLGALPDVGSAIVVQWGVPTQEYSHPIHPLSFSQTVALDVGPDESMNPAFMELRWRHNETDQVATVSTDGTISGAAVGSVDLANNKFTFTPVVLPQPGTEITATYDIGPQSVTQLSSPSRGGDGRLAVNAGATNLVPGSVVVEWNTDTDLAVLDTYTRDQLNEMGIGSINPVDPLQVARDDGNGRLLLRGADVGAVNYVTGDIVFNPDVTIMIPAPRYVQGPLVSGNGTNASSRWRLNYVGIGYVAAPSLYPNNESGWVRIKYYEVGGESRHTHTFLIAPEFPLIEGSQAPTVPGSVVIRTLLGSLLWGDSGTGTLREVQTDGSVISRGTIDYGNSRVRLTSWPANTTGIDNTRLNLITSLGENVSSAYVFRTAAAPLRPGSLSLQFARFGGGTQTVTADLDGVITAAGVTGSVDYQTGLVRLGFGAWVAAAGNESEPWYNPAAVVNGQIFKPAPVASSTVKYTAVAFSYMPLDASLIGVDPVRLPSDGRVAIFRNGTMVVVGNTAVMTGITPSNNQVIDLGRTRLSRAVVRDATGTSVLTGYSVDLEAGRLTFEDVTGITAPVSIEHRIEDMLVVREVEISGNMVFTRQISHNYPVENTYVSSALEFGDRRARVSVTFDQATWNGVEWADAPTSASAPASYNTTLSPIIVTNMGASTERFALWFTSATQFRILGEHVGQIGTGDINTVCAPVNPATGVPYFTIDPLGWGTGWATGNVLRLNTVGALAPVWVVRTVQPGVEAGIDYSFDLLTRGDVDRP